MSAKQIYVRLAPFAPRHGNLVQRYVYRGQLFRGGSNPHWYKVPAAVASELAELRQDDGNPLSRPLFEVMDEDEKQRVQAEEHRRKLASLGVITPTSPIGDDVKPAVTHDLTRGGPRGRGKSYEELSLPEEDPFVGAVTSTDASGGRDAALVVDRGEDGVDVDVVSDDESGD